MDLRAYLEQDMITFLETRLSVDYLKEQSASAAYRPDESTAMFLQDYETELFDALHKHDITRAKEVLHKVKDTFATYPLGSPERKQLQALLHSLYEKFKQYLEDESAFSKIEDALDHVDEPQVASERMSSPAKMPQVAAANSSVSEFLETLEHLDDALAQANIGAAHKHYRTAKELYKKLPKEHQQKHREKMLDHHKKIASLMKPALQPKKTQSIPQNNIPAPVPKSAEPKTDSQNDAKLAQPLEEKTPSQPTIPPSIVRIEKDMVAAMREGQLHEAMLHYEELRAESLRLPADGQHVMFARLQKYHVWLMEAWKRWKQKTQMQGSLLDAHEKKLTGRP